MKLNSQTRYGLRACYILAQFYNKNSVSASELERYLNVSSKYVEQIMRKLSAGKIVGANRGATGGYFLLRSPNEVTVGEIVRLTENGVELVECVKKDSSCKCCPTSRTWKKVNEKINQVLDEITLEQMINGDI